MTRSVLIAGGCFVFALAFLVSRLFVSSSSAAPDAQVSAYEADAPVKKRELATVAIARQGRSSIPELRDIAASDPSPRVVAAAIGGLGDHFDYQSVELMLEQLTMSDSKVVRIRANNALGKLIGIRAHLDDDASPHRCRQAAELYRRAWRGMNGSKALDEHKQMLSNTYGDAP